MFESAILTLCVFSDGDHIDSCIRSIYSFNASAWSNVGVELQSFSKCNVEGAETLAYWRLERPLQSDLVLP